MNPLDELIRKQAKRLHLANVKNNLDEILEQAQLRQPSYIAFIEYIFSEELKFRANTAKNKRMREACFPYLKKLEDLDLDFLKSLTKKDLNELAELKWVEGCFNLILYGPPGTGKTHLAIGLGIKAVEKGYSVSFVTMNELIKLLKTEETNQRSHARIERIKKSAVLILDEVGYLPVDRRESGLFFHLLSEIIEKCSIIITSNKPFSKWPEFFGDPDLVVAAADRIVQQCEVIKLEGESYRFIHRKNILSNN